MPAPYKYNRRKTFTSIKQTNFRTFRKSYFSKNSLFSHYINGKKIDAKKIRSFPLINKIMNEIIIEWENGEKEIYLTGSFCSYHNFFSKNKFFEKKYDFLNVFKKLKFKSEGNIKINSVYLLSKNKIENSSKTSQKKISISTKESSHITLESKINNKLIDFSFSKINYCNYYPKLNEMKEMADKKPCHFPIECFHGVNKFHKEIGSKEFLLLDENNVFNSNNESYKIIDKKDHIVLNHFTNKNSIINNNIIINSVTIKYRHKNSTFIYYK
jgi:hypothetical protein